ncbi:MAG: TIGR04219 family outer membrane beta-barrel protein [Campylobacterota bacterium]|nr:TIGR04219 family outer membrane beta-barrel protein [Campylobacterota bacterium]
MKKILASLACGAMLASTASSDMIKIEGGAGIWQQTPSGDAEYTDATTVDGENKFDEDQLNKGYVWMLIKHPIPIVPNLRLEYTSLESTGKATGEFKDYTVTVGAEADTFIEMKQYDIIPYFNILDNLGWTTVDIGLDLKVVEASYKADGVIDNDTGFPINYSDSATVVIPLLYLRARVEFPATNLAVEADTKYISYGDSYLIDTRAKIDYTLDFVPVIKPAIEVGYRYQGYKFDDDDQDGKIDLTFSGFYAGVMLRY